MKNSRNENLVIDCLGATITVPIIVFLVGVLITTVISYLLNKQNNTDIREQNVLSTKNQSKIIVSVLKISTIFISLSTWMYLFADCRDVGPKGDVLELAPVLVT